MNEKYRFLHCIGFLLLLATAAQSNKSVTRCAEKGGFCVPKDLCDPGSEFLCDEENEVCCPYDPLSKTKRSPRDIEIPCQLTAPSKKCEFAYNGVCQSWCKDGRVPTGFCSRDCLCCGCPTTDKCREFSGYCTVNSCSCSGTIIPDLCDGEKCICCLPEECLPSDECAANNGTCRKTCAEGEEPLPGAGCVDVVGDSCMCCVPTCPNTTACLDIDGYCTSNLDETCNGTLLSEMCAGEECSCCWPDACPDAQGYYSHPNFCKDIIISEWSPGENCVCCSPNCPDSDFCREAQGYCSHPDFCSGSIGPELCPGNNCICCLPGPYCNTTFDCGSAGGYCSQTCPYWMYPDPYLCKNGCNCCIEIGCPQTQACQEVYYGYCTHPANCYEKIVPELCEGEKCVCCAPVCLSTQPCIDNYGYCTISENCYEKIVPEWCEGEGCICCAPVCPPTQQCQEAYGYCSSPDSCYGKYVPEWCDGEDCVCCVQDCFPYPECLDVNGYCTSPDTCSGNIVPEWCGGEMCVCCVPDDCNVTSPPKECIVNYAGMCQKDCEDGRIPTGFCFGDCQCCGCPTTDECKANLGYCTECHDTCNGINNPELCPGEKCTCCMPAIIIDPCETPVDCQLAGGYCSQTCPPWLYPDPNLCPDGCNCCLEKFATIIDLVCETPDDCRLAGGYCSQTCPSWLYPDPNLCPDGCNCCLEKDATITAIIDTCETPVNCQFAGGYCSQTCPPWLYPDPNLCPDGCNCCLEKDELAPLYH